MWPDVAEASGTCRTRRARDGLARGRHGLAVRRSTTGDRDDQRKERAVDLPRASWTATTVTVSVVSSYW